jgi:hypothetical protein
MLFKRVKINNPLSPHLSLIKKPKNFSKQMHRFKQMLVQRQFHSWNKVSHPTVNSQKEIEPEQLQLTDCHNSSVDPNMVFLESLHFRLRETKSHIVDLSKINENIHDDINRLIKKLALSFTAKKNESQLFIAEGIFQGTRLKLKIDNHDLRLSVNNASKSAAILLKNNQKLLKSRLLKHEINLCEIRFTS